MRKIIPLILLLAVVANVSGQINQNALEKRLLSESGENKFDSIAKVLGYKGGDIILVNTIFTINKNGEIVNIRARGPHPYFEQEAIRILENTPEIVPENFKPKEEDPSFALPIRFVVETDKQKARRQKREKKN